MKEEKFRVWLLKQKRRWNGKVDFYTENAVNSRVGCLKKLEIIFNIDLDEKVTRRNVAIEFLKEIRNKNIEDLKHTPLSNAFRHYYKFATGDFIDKIF